MNLIFDFHKVARSLSNSARLNLYTSYLFNQMLFKFTACKFSTVGVITALIATFGFSSIFSGQAHLNSTSNQLAQPNATPPSRHPSRAIPWQLAKPFSPPNRGAPARTSDGGTRGCPAAMSAPGNRDRKPLTTLTLSQNIPLTVSAYPTFLWYVPSPVTENLSLQFALFEFDVAGNEDSAKAVYRTTLPAPDRSGIVQLKLPEKPEYQLREGKTYHWYIEMACDPDDPLESVFSEGFIERIPANQLKEDASHRLSAIDPNNALALSAFYADMGVWHEALAYLAQERQSAPQNREVAQRWLELLDSVELGDFAEAHILN